MSESASLTPAKAKRPYKRTPRRQRPDITINGEIWTPRIKLADDLCMSEKAIRGYGLKTIYVAGSAHNRREELLQALINETAEES
jgi:hypothetical protein